MSDETSADLTPAEPASRPWRVPFRRMFAWHRQRMARWLEELLVVFVGVYAAFFLNYRSVHRQERQRREQLLTWVEEC